MKVGKEESSKGELDLSTYRDKASEHAPLKDLSQLSTEDAKVLLMAGIDPTGRERSGSFLQMDHSVIHCRTDFKGLEGCREHRTTTRSTCRSCPATPRRK
jgi:hypothetical protein